MFTYTSSSKWQYHLNEASGVVETAGHYSLILLFPDTLFCKVVLELRATLAAKWLPCMPCGAVGMDHIASSSETS
jgi:hypothetical protein